MTAEQYRLYGGIVKLMRRFGTGGASWRRTRGPASTITQTGGVALRFCQNNRVAQANTLPAIPIFTAPWWGVADASVDIQSGDIYDNGVIAFLITGTPDSSQGFLVIPAAVASIPRSVVLQSGAGYRAGLRIGAF